MRDYSLYVGPDLKDFELVRVRIKFNADKAREIMFSISRLTGELVMPGSCYASIKPIFDKYGLSDVYEYVKIPFTSALTVLLKTEPGMR